MKTLKGKTTSKRIVTGKISLQKDDSYSVTKRHIDDVSGENAIFMRTIEEGVNELNLLKGKSKATVGAEDIFDAHIMLMEDAGFADGVKQMICEDKVNAAFAVWTVGNGIINKLSELDDEIFSARAIDMRDVVKRLIHILEKTPSEEGANDNCKITEPGIIVAEDVSPSEFATMDKDKVLAIVTKGGSRHSHMAIMAGMMGIPVLVSVRDLNLNEVSDGDVAIVNPENEEVIFNPDEETLNKFHSIIKEQDKHSELLMAYKGKETITKSGRKINLYANIGSLSSLDKAVENDAEGIGLFRSEFLYIGRNEAPTEDEQFDIYCRVAKAMENRVVTIRTLDIGTDKQEPYLGMECEANPAMGCRAVRYGLTRPDIFKTQLRALLRASVYGNIRIMYPMITSVSEVLKVQELIKEAADELKGMGCDYRIPKQGIMIETPAAALISDQLAKVSDFFAIGTNDLTQFTLAMGRLNNALDEFYDAHHPAVLKMIEMTVNAAHAEGITVSVCGELASDLSILENLIDFGVDELSVSASKLLNVRKHICELP